MEHIRDGHTLGITLEDEHVKVEMLCPHNLSDYQDSAWESMPVCLRAADEDGTPDLKNSGKECLVALEVNDEGAVWRLHLDRQEFSVSSLPVLVGYWWDLDTILIRPYTEEA